MVSLTIEGFKTCCFCGGVVDGSDGVSLCWIAQKVRVLRHRRARFRPIQHLIVSQLCPISNVSARVLYVVSRTKTPLEPCRFVADFIQILKSARRFQNWFEIRTHVHAKRTQKDAIEEASLENTTNTTRTQT